MASRRDDSMSMDSGVQHSAAGNDMFVDDETHLKQQLQNSAAASDSPQQSYDYHRQYAYYPQIDMRSPTTNYYPAGNFRHAGASGQPKSDDSTSLTSEHSGLVDMLNKTFLGNKKKKKKGESPSIIHIGKVIINPPPPPPPAQPPGIYGEPIYFQSPNVQPPDPCNITTAHNKGYMVIPGASSSGSVNMRSPVRHPVEQGGSILADFHPLRQVGREPDTEPEDVVDEDIAETSSKQDSAVSASIPEERTDEYAKMSRKIQQKYRSTPALIGNNPSHTPQIKMKFPPSYGMSVESVPEKFEISLRLPGSEASVWKGHVTCERAPPDDAVDTPILSPVDENVNWVPRTYTRSSSYTAPQPSPKPTSHRHSTPPYENFSPPFTGHQPYREGNAGDDITASAPAMMHNYQHQNQQLNFRGRQWKASPSVHNLSESVPNVSHVHSKVPPQKVNCADHSCLGDGFHDTDDENELGHIRDYMQRAGKPGQWVVSRLNDHPLYPYCLHVKISHRVAIFPIAFTKKKKYKIDPDLKGFRCICKLIAHYQTNKLPHVNCNLARECFPKDNIPSHSSYSDTSDVVNDQYASVNPQQNKVPPVNAVEITPL